ncbi:MAG: flagellar hook basal-body protein [Candidatus Margulisiibacteriota bacterium]
MLDIMSSAADAIESYNSRLRATSANITNMSVTGYKKMFVSFETVMNNVYKSGTAATNNEGGTNPFQSGGSVAIANTGLDFSQGDTQTSSGLLGLYAQGRGLFIVSKDDGKTLQYTRAGDFRVDSNKNLVTASGMKVFGFARNNGATSGNLAPIGLTDLPLTKTSGGNTFNLTFDDQGVLRYFRVVDATKGEIEYLPETASSYQIALTTFNNASGLTMLDGTTYGVSAASGPADTPVAPGGSAGIVLPRTIEASNVFYITETVDAVETQRALSASLTVVKMISDTISQFIQKVS